jgi:hypothetical protein
MTREIAPKVPQLRDRWALLPPPLAQAVLGVVYDAFDRRPPFDGMPRSAFDQALDRVPPPPGLTPAQFRRAVFEEMNNLPWSEGLAPPPGGSWLPRTPMETMADRVFFMRPDLYRFKRKAANRIVAAMQADGSLGPDCEINLNFDLVLRKVRRGHIRVGVKVSVRYAPAPSVNTVLDVSYSDRVPCLLVPYEVFMNPDLGPVESDAEAERVVRQMWRYAEALYEAIVEALPSISGLAPEDGSI